MKGKYIDRLENQRNLNVAVGERGKSCKASRVLGRQKKPRTLRQHPARGRADSGASCRSRLRRPPNSKTAYGQLPQPHRAAPGSYPNIPGSLCRYPRSKYKYLKINTPLVRGTENISSIKVNVKGIHTRSKGHEIENNHMPSSRGPFVRVAFTSAA